MLKFVIFYDRYNPRNHILDYLEKRLDKFFDFSSIHSKVSAYWLQ